MSEPQRVRVEISREAQFNLIAAGLTLMALVLHPAFILAALGFAVASLYIQIDASRARKRRRQK